MHPHPSADDAVIRVQRIIPLRQARELLERELISRALALKGSTREAAAVLGVDHSTVVRKALRYNLATREQNRSL